MNINKKKPLKFLLRLRENELFKTTLPEKTIKMSKKWIKMIEKPETIKKINHENLS